MSERLCWWVDITGEPEEGGDFVWAPSRGKARAAAGLGCDFIGVRARRFPPGDGLTHVSDRLMVEHGYQPLCLVCYERVYEYEAAFDERDRAYHDHCYDRRRAMEVTA